MEMKAASNGCFQRAPTAVLLTDEAFDTKFLKWSSCYVGISGPENVSVVMFNQIGTTASFNNKHTVSSRLGCPSREGYLTGYCRVEM